MTTTEKIAAIALILLLAAAGYGLLRTSGPMVVLRGSTTSPAQMSADVAVDQSSLSTAQRLASMVTSADEEPYALEAIRIADHAVDLQFAQAM